jgi:hypothetical protein
VVPTDSEQTIGPRFLDKSLTNNDHNILSDMSSHTNAIDAAGHDKGSRFPTPPRTVVPTNAVNAAVVHRNSINAAVVQKKVDNTAVAHPNAVKAVVLEKNINKATSVSHWNTVKATVVQKKVDNTAVTHPNAVKAVVLQKRRWTTTRARGSAVRTAVE